jgi:hypothetical protein
LDYLWRLELPTEDEMRGPHDMGGLPAGPIDREPHDMTFWEKQIDAMSQLLGRSECAILHAGENRRSIESLGDDVYRKLNYYERWTAGISRLLLEKGILTQDEIGRKIDELRARFGQAGDVPMTTAKPPRKAAAKAKAKSKVKAKPKRVAVKKSAAKKTRAKPAKKKAPAARKAVKKVAKRKAAPARRRRS